MCGIFFVLTQETLRQIYLEDLEALKTKILASN